MTQRKIIRRSAALLASAALSFAFTPALADIGSAVRLGAGASSSTPVEPGQRLDLPGPAAQVMLDNGTIVSFVGAGSLTVGEDGAVTIHSGAATVLAAGPDTLVNLPGDVVVAVAGGGGASTLNVTGDTFTGNSLAGGMTVSSGLWGASFQAGQGWSVRPGERPERVFANAAQPVVGASGGGLAEAALEGQPVSLGQALAALGASAEVVAAAERLEAASQNPALGAFPSGDVALLVEYAQSLANLYGGPAFEGAGPALVSTYLSYLADGGLPDAFQETYGELLVQYIALLREGGLPSDFGGPGEAAVTAYLDYIRGLGALEALSDQDQAFIEAYLSFLGEGGVGGDFAGFYVQAIADYLAFLQEGGLPSEYAGLSQALVAQYLALLQSTGLLDALLAEQSQFLLAYLDYLQDGGDPDDYEDLPVNQEPEEPEEPEEPGGPPVGNVELPEFASGAYNMVALGSNVSTLIHWDKSNLTFGEDGAPNEFGSYRRGTAVLAAGDGDLSEGWMMGRLAGGDFVAVSNPAIKNTQAAGEGVHFLVMRLVESLPPSGSVDYALHAYTSPTYVGGDPITDALATGAMRVDFGAMKWGFNADLSFKSAGQTMNYAMRTQGGTTNLIGLLFLRDGQPVMGGETSLFEVTSNDPRCGGDCGALFQFMMGGASGELAGGTYGIQNNSGSPILAGGLLFKAGEEEETPVSGTERTGQVIAYSGSTIGIDLRTGVRTWTETDGTLNKYLWPTNDVERPERGTNQSLETGTAGGVIGWSRWAGGTTAGRYFSTPPVTRTANQGMHQVYGSPATNLPASGTVNYALSGSTKPTIRDGSAAPGTFGGSAAVAFGATPKVGLDLQVGIGGHTYNVATTGGAADPGSSQLSVESNMSFRAFGLSATAGGPACGGSACTGEVAGFLAGEGASHLGLVYTINGGTFDKQVDGAAVFARP